MCVDDYSLHYMHGMVCSTHQRLDRGIYCRIVVSACIHSLSFADTKPKTYSAERKRNNKWRCAPMEHYYLIDSVHRTRHTRRQGSHFVVKVQRTTMYGRYKKIKRRWFICLYLFPSFGIRLECSFSHFSLFHFGRHAMASRNCFSSPASRLLRFNCVRCG